MDLTDDQKNRLIHFLIIGIQDYVDGHVSEDHFVTNEEYLITSKDLEAKLDPTTNTCIISRLRLDYQSQNNPKDKRFLVLHKYWIKFTERDFLYVSHSQSIGENDIAFSEEK